MKIGIPAGLLYYSFCPLWKTFFEELGAEVVMSGPTNKNVLDYGVKLCVDEACLPVKVYHGHIKNLSDKVDAVFIPRIMSISKNEYICPKFCGLPDMVKHSIPDVPFIIDTTVNLRKSNEKILDSIMHAGSVLTNNSNRIKAAFKTALCAQAKFENALRRTGDFESSINTTKNKNNSRDETEGRKIAVIGHPYNTYDSFINMNIQKKLRSEGYSVLTIEMLDPKIVDSCACKMPKRHFWTFGRKILGAGLSFLESRDIYGLIYLSSFGCGIDSLMEDYLERHIRRDGKIAYMKITLDEHSGEAGLNTRLEAFLDMVKWREENESDISPHGRNIYSGERFS